MAAIGACALSLFYTPHQMQRTGLIMSMFLFADFSMSKTITTQPTPLPLHCLFFIFYFPGMYFYPRMIYPPRPHGLPVVKDKANVSQYWQK